jgi:GntR family transcriptional regulator, trigonelline degradation regulator
VRTGHRIQIDRNTPSLREKTTQALRDAILQLHFKPGQRLVERKLCAETGVSRTCIRESLRLLEAEGLVDRAQNKGVFVATISPEEAQQIYEVRGALEPECARLFVARASDAEIEALGRALARVERSLERKPINDYVDAFDAFYDVLLRGARNEVARSMLHSLRARMNYLRARTAQVAEIGRKLETLELLRGIHEAAAKRDAETMARRCRDFVRRSAEYAAEVIGDDASERVRAAG